MQAGGKYLIRLTQTLERELRFALSKLHQSDLNYDALEKSEKRFSEEYNAFHGELSLATDNCTDGHNWRMMLGNIIRERDSLGNIIRERDSLRAQCDSMLKEQVLRDRHIAELRAENERLRASLCVPLPRMI